MGENTVVCLFSSAVLFDNRQVLPTVLSKHCKKKKTSYIIKTYVHKDVFLVMLMLYVCGSLSLWQYNQARSKGGVSGAGGERSGFLL